MRIIMTTIAAAVLASTAAMADGKMVIAKGVAADFEAYQRSIGAVGSGIYAITEDGQGGVGFGCAQANCQSKAASAAIEKCEAMNPGRKCMVFARNRQPVVKYEIAK